MKIVKYLIVLVSLIGGSIAAYMYFKPVTDTRGKESDYVYTAEAFVAEFARNPQEANKKFQDKVIQISGKVHKIVSEDAVHALVFDLGSDYIIVCDFSAQYASALHQVNRNQNIKLKGYYSGYIINDEDFFIPADIKLTLSTLVP